MAKLQQAANTAIEFVFRRTFDAPREDVWNAFTQPQHLKHWWGPPGSTIEIAHHELKPGGIFHYCMKFPDGRAMWARFIYREIVVPERLVWLNSFSDELSGLTRNPWVPGFPLETLNTVIMVEHNGKTQLTITVVPFNANEEESGLFAAGINGMKIGFDRSFKVLADYLAQRADGGD
ncbi:MAG: SRPBCC domain-containing protein [Acidobacteriia bacterium]|nr:SRPBCC domain-containing protein [Terriglobia bacterium]